MSQINRDFDALAPKPVNSVIFGWPFNCFAEDKIAGTDNGHLGEWKADRYNYLATFRRKLAFAQASHLHWDVASELLFRQLQIYDYDTLVHIADIAASETSIAGKAIRSWTKDLRFRLSLNFEEEKDLGASIQHSVIRIQSHCPGLQAISVLIRPHNNGETFWPVLMRTLMDHVPTSVQRLELETFDYKLVDFKDVKDQGDPTAPPAQLTSLRVDGLCGIQSLSRLRHLYINFPQYTHNLPLWEIDLPCLELLHLGPKARLERQNAESLFSRLPSLRVFEYHYCRESLWPEDFWTCPTPPSLRKIKVKTFEFRDKWSNVFGTPFDTDPFEAFCRHVVHIFLIGIDDPPGSPRRRPGVKIIFPDDDWFYMCIHRMNLFFRRVIPFECLKMKNALTVDC